MVRAERDEWHKAAYHKNDGVTGNYWDFPTSSDRWPTAENPPGGANSANYFNAIGNEITVGAYMQSANSYGTFDQGGNLTEWTETITTASNRVVRGGSWASNWGDLVSYGRTSISPESKSTHIGFRIARVSELISADFDDDGDVDGDDFLLWQTGFGTSQSGHLFGDADGDGDTDGDDFLIWQSQFGGGSGSASAAVPEPASVVLLLLALGCVWNRLADSLKTVSGSRQTG